jgi:hypothetical protein
MQLHPYAADDANAFAEVDQARWASDTTSRDRLRAILQFRAHFFVDSFYCRVERAVLSPSALFSLFSLLVPSRDPRLGR